MWGCTVIIKHEELSHPMKMMQADEFVSQTIQVMVMRAQQGKHQGTFAGSPLTNREGYVVLIGNVPDEFKGMITINTAEGPVEIDASGLSANIVISEAEHEKLNNEKLDRYVITANAVVTINTQTESRNAKYSNTDGIRGKLWVEPTEETSCAPAAGRAGSKQAVLDAVNFGKQNRANFFASRAAAGTVQAAQQNQSQKLGSGVSAK